VEVAASQLAGFDYFEKGVRLVSPQVQSAICDRPADRSVQLCDRRLDKRCFGHFSIPVKRRITSSSIFNKADELQLSLLFPVHS
jgi:hypothetical protein